MIFQISNAHLKIKSVLFIFKLTIIFSSIDLFELRIIGTYKKLVEHYNEQLIIFLILFVAAGAEAAMADPRIDLPGPAVWRQARCGVLLSRSPLGPSGLSCTVT